MDINQSLSLRLVRTQTKNSIFATHNFQIKLNNQQIIYNSTIYYEKRLQTDVPCCSPIYGGL